MYRDEEYVAWLKTLLETANLTDFESICLRTALDRIEKSNNIPAAMYQLKNDLLVKAFTFELSPDLLDFYQHINRYFSLYGSIFFKR
ncbi:bacteriocin immunity protein [Streptococcus suis]|nr:bacteriocin immunity protein [Streptococcus suis]